MSCRVPCSDRPAPVSRLLLIQEKEQYLCELQRVAASQRSTEEADLTQSRICRLKMDIQEAMEMSHTIIADRSVQATLEDRHFGRAGNTE